MNFNQYYFTERLGITNKKLIVIDIQPLYEDGIKRKFSISDFGNFLKQAKNGVLYFYNGPDTIASDDSEDAIMNWLIDNNEDLIDYDWNSVEFYDKGYSFFRDWMDAGVSNNGILKALRYMFMNRKHDSRDVTIDEWREVLPESDFKAIGHNIEDESLTIWTPDISIGDLKANWNNSLLCGGGINECLKEMTLLLSTFNIRYTMVDKYIY